MVSKSKSHTKTKSKTPIKTKPKRKFITKKNIIGLTGAGLLAYYLYKNKKNQEVKLIEKIKNLSVEDIFGTEENYNDYLSTFKLDNTERLKFHEFLFINGKKRDIPPPKEYTSGLNKSIDLNTNEDFIKYVNVNRKKRGYQDITISEIQKNFSYRNKNNIKKLESLKEKLDKEKDLQVKEELCNKITLLIKQIRNDITLILYPYLTINKYFV